MLIHVWYVVIRLWSFQRHHQASQYMLLLLQACLDQLSSDGALLNLIRASSCSMLALTYIRHSMPKLLEAIQSLEHQPEVTHETGILKVVA